MRFKFNVSLLLLMIPLSYSFGIYAMKRNINHDPLSSPKKFKSESELEQKAPELCEHYQCGDKIDIYNCDPLTLIKHVAKHHLQDSIDALFSYNITSDSEEDDIYTSCYHTASLIASIFLGEEKAKLCFVLLDRRETKQFEISIDGKLLPLSVYGLFDGPRLCKCKIYYDPFLHCLDQQSKALALENDFDRCFSKLRFSFNYDAVYELRRTIEDNVSNINIDSSFVYIVGIADEDTYRHVAVIEQRFNSSGVQYILYQSWLAKINLAEWLERMEVLDHKGMRRFLDKLKIILCDFDDIKANYSSCFGVDSPRGTLLECKEQKLTGLGLRFLCYNIDPKSCGKNLHDLMFNCDNELSDSND